MTKKNGTKRSLLMSALALVLCFSMLIGSTFAWFTDSVTSSGNIIKSGTLEVEMYYADGTKAVPGADSPEWKDASTGTIFNNDKWEPGYVEVRHIKIENKGSLALKYQLSIAANGEVSDLTDVIDVYYVDPAVQVADRTALADDALMGTLTEVLAGMAATASGELNANTSDTITIALKMQESAGNDYQNKTIGSDFSVQLVATQLSNESDSFGNTYDQTATYPNGVFVSAPIEAAPAVVEDNTFTYTNADETVKVSGTTVNNTNPVTVTVVPTATSNDLVEIVDNTGKSVVSYNIDVEGHDEGEAVTVELFVGKNLVGVEVYHAGTKMTSGATYDAASGYVTIITDSFSPFEIVFYSAEDVPAASAGVTTAAELQKVLNEGGYAVLAADITAENNKRFAVPAGITAVLDLNGHTLTSKDGGGSNTMAIYIDKGAVLTLNDSVGTGKIVSSCYGVYVKQNAKFIMNGGTIEVSGNGVYDIGVCVWNADFVMNGGIINSKFGVWASNYYRDVAGETGLNTCYVKIADGCDLNSTGYADVEYMDAPDAVIDVPTAVVLYPNPVSTTEELIDAIKNAPVGEESIIYLTNGTYSDDINMTVAALGTVGGDVVIKAMKGTNPVITGTVTLGYRNQTVGATMYDANVTFEGITFDHANSATHSLDIQDVKSLILKNCTIIGDGEYGVTSARGNGTGTSKIVGCTFENAGMQLLGNLATGLVIDDCTFNNSCINVQAGNGVTVQNCEFNNTLTSANIDDSFYAIRSNSTPITVKGCEINIDSELTEVVSTAQAKWYLLANRGTTNWTVENVAVTLTDAAAMQTQLKVTACTSTGAINTTNLTVNGVAQ